MIALDTRAPGAARDFVVQSLEQRVVAPALDSAQLLVSELVTNSFVTAANSWARSGWFGLNLVEMLSERWGVERLVGGGTQVWAQLAPRDPGGMIVASGDRLTQLRALVDRLERLPASTRRDWMLQEARSRMVDVETGDKPRPMRTLHENRRRARRNGRAGASVTAAR